MTLTSASTIHWLLDSDPSIRWQVMRDLTDTPADVVAAERARVASEGWGARLLELQGPDGNWGDGKTFPFWWTNMYTLVFLRDLGVDPANPRVRAAIELIRDNFTFGPEFGNSPFFDGVSWVGGAKLQVRNATGCCTASPRSKRFAHTSIQAPPRLPLRAYRST